MQLEGVPGLDSYDGARQASRHKLKSNTLSIKEVKGKFFNMQLFESLVMSTLRLK